MRRFLNHIIRSIAVLTIVITATAAMPATQRWEPVETTVTELSEERLDVSVRGQYIYVYSPEPVNVKVFTILGQLVSQANLQAGTSRLRVNTRGIYILKAGSITRRITI